MVRARCHSGHEGMLLEDKFGESRDYCESERMMRISGELRVRGAIIIRGGMALQNAYGTRLNTMGVAEGMTMMQGHNYELHAIVNGSSSKMLS